MQSLWVPLDDPGAADECARGNGPGKPQEPGSGERCVGEVVGDMTILETLAAERKARLERQRDLLRQQYPEIYATAQRFKEAFGPIVVRNVREKA